MVDATRKLELLLNFLLVRSFFGNLRNLTGFYGASVKVDWAEFFSYFDLLDAVIINDYDKAEFQRCADIIIAASNSIEYANFYVTSQTAYAKLNKFTERIVIELYRDQFSINHYANMDLESLKETTFLEDGMVYLYFFKGKEQAVINDYVGLDVNNQNFKESTQIYFTAAMDHCKRMYHDYGDRVLEALHLMWNSSYADRLTVIKTIKAAQLANVAEEIPNYNPNFCDYFSLWECLTFWWQSQYVEKPGSDKVQLCSQGHVDMISGLVGAEPGSKLTADIMTLYSYLMPLEVLATEYICLQYYAVTGVKRDLAAYSRDITNGVRQLCAANANFD